VAASIQIGSYLFDNYHAMAHNEPKPHPDHWLEFSEVTAWREAAAYRIHLLQTFDEDWWWRYWADRYEAGANLDTSLVGPLRSRGLI
jgi:hypothetical protein